MAILLFAIFGLLLLILVSGAYMFVVGCVRNKEISWLDEVAVKKTSFGMFHESIQLAHNWLIDQNAQDHFIQSEDGLTLHGLWIPAVNAKGTIVLVHGYRSTYLVDFAAAFEYYHDLGLNLLVPDQRSHGKSQGRFITFGVKESGDIARWIAYHNQYLSDCEIILNGLSMGASTVLYLADQRLPENVKGIIADCGFTSPKEILASVYRSVIRLPAGPTLWAANIFTRLFAGFGLEDKDTRRCLSNSKLPVLLFHGRDDDFVPCRMSEEGYAACTGEKELYLVKGAKHGVSFLVDAEGYTKKVIAFLQQNLSLYGQEQS